MRISDIFGWFSGRMLNPGVDGRKRGGGLRGIGVGTSRARWGELVSR
jgi:hypothetical protein